jgi:hypothetical protein
VPLDGNFLWANDSSIYYDPADDFQRIHLAYTLLSSTCRSLVSAGVYDSSDASSHPLGDRKPSAASFILSNPSLASSFSPNLSPLHFSFALYLLKLEFYLLMYKQRPYPMHAGVLVYSYVIFVCVCIYLYKCYIFVCMWIC